MSLSTSILFTVIPEVLVFFHLGTNVSAVGIQRLLQVSMFAYVVRRRLNCNTSAALLYSKNLWLMLSMEVLHGLTFACSWVAGAAHCKHAVPPDLQRCWACSWACVQVSHNNTLENID